MSERSTIVADRDVSLPPGLRALRKRTRYLASIGLHPPAIRPPVRSCRVVEDDRQASGLVRYYLQEDGCSVARAHTGEQAIRMAQELQPVVPLDTIHRACRERAVAGSLGGRKEGSV